MKLVRRTAKALGTASSLWIKNPSNDSEEGAGSLKAHDLLFREEVTSSKVNVRSLRRMQRDDSALRCLRVAI